MSVIYSFIYSLCMRCLTLDQLVAGIHKLQVDPEKSEYGDNVACIQIMQRELERRAKCLK